MRIMRMMIFYTHSLYGVVKTYDIPTKKGKLTVHVCMYVCMSKYLATTIIAVEGHCWVLYLTMESIFFIF